MRGLGLFLTLCAAVPALAQDMERLPLVGDWINGVCPWFETVRELSVGAKHFASTETFKTERVGAPPFMFGKLGQDGVKAHGAARSHMRAKSRAMVLC
jgi:hypothetical protein